MRSITSNQNVDQLKHRYPFLTVNVEPLASGLLAMFSDEERTILRFGMLPAQKMQCFEQNLEAKFRELWNVPTGQDEFDLLTVRDEECHFYDNLSLRRIMSDVIHAVSLQIYKMGDLVV